MVKTRYPDITAILHNGIKSIKCTFEEAEAIIKVRQAYPDCKAVAVVDGCYLPVNEIKQGHIMVQVGDTIYKKEKGEYNWPGVVI